MHVEALRAALHRSPFEPFVLGLADGRSLSVPHPDFVLVSQRHVIVVNPQDESVVWVEPLLVVTLDFIQSQKGNTSGNGAEGKGNPS